jgi:hypothetical protein
VFVNETFGELRHGEIRNTWGILVGNLEETNHLGDLMTVGRIKLKQS